MNEQALSKIPFQLKDELMIHSMARWMKFIGVYNIVVSLLVLFVALVASIYAGVEMVSEPAALGKMGRILAENKLTFFSLGAFTLILGGVGTVMGFLLYQAAEDFDRVVRTDEADQDYITAGLIQLETYFKYCVLLAFAVVLVGMTAGLSLALKYGAVS